MAGVGVVYGACNETEESANAIMVLCASVLRGLVVAVVLMDTKMDIIKH